MRTMQQLMARRKQDISYVHALGCFDAWTQSMTALVKVRLVRLCTAGASTWALVGHIRAASG